MNAKQKKQAAIVAGAALALYLIYRWYRGSQANASTAAATGTSAPNTTASDYASLAGQEQSDVAALQGQNTDLLGQIQTLTSQIAAIPAGATGDTGPAGPAGPAGADGTGTAATAMGQLPGRPTGPALIAALNMTRQPNTGHYVMANGKPQLIHAVGKGKWAPGPPPPATHPSAPKNTTVAHPNPTHGQQAAAYSPSKAYAMPTPSKPAPQTKSKTSGRRK